LARPISSAAGLSSSPVSGVTHAAGQCAISANTPSRQRACSANAAGVVTVAVSPIRICGGSGSGTSPRRCGLRKTRSPLRTWVTLPPAATTRAIALVPGTNGIGGRL
jgi:hypothetical protein